MAMSRSGRPLLSSQKWNEVEGDTCVICRRSRTIRVENRPALGAGQSSPGRGGAWMRVNSLVNQLAEKKIRIWPHWLHELLHAFRCLPHSAAEEVSGLGTVLLTSRLNFSRRHSRICRKRAASVCAFRRRPRLLASSGAAIPPTDQVLSPRKCRWRKVLVHRAGELSSGDVDWRSRKAVLRKHWCRSHARPLNALIARGWLIHCTTAIPHLRTLTDRNCTRQDAVGSERSR